MPLKSFESLCSPNAAQITSRDRGNPQYHRGINKGKVYVTHYKIDGTVIKTGNRCDYLLMNEGKLSDYTLQYRIVANKCKTQEIYSSAYRKYQIRWKGRLIQKTGFIEENI